MRSPSITVNPRAKSAPLPAAAREETLPGSRRPLAARRFSSSELRSTRFLVSISAMTAIVFAFVAVLGFQLLRYIFHGAATTGSEQCVEGDDDKCLEGQTCISGRCAAAAPPKHCQVGDTCDSCEAGPSLQCGEHGKYVAKTPASKDICRDPEVTRFLTEVGKKCGTLKSCETSQLEDFAITHDDFLELMKAIPGTAALHFNSGTPNSQLWPAEGGKVETHYVKGMDGLVEALAGAETVLLVALSSRDTPRDVPDARQAADALTLARAQAAQRLIRSAAGPSSTAAELDRLDEKLKFVLLGKRKQLDASFYVDTVVRSVTWDQSSQDKLRTLIEADGPLLPREKRWRDRTINQTVFVVPIPCGLGAR